MTGKIERLWAVVEPYVAAEGIELDDLEIVGKEPGVVVRVTLDATDGVGVDKLAELSRRLSRLFDEQDPVAGSYTLEISSPGLERKLRRPRHFEKSVGRNVKVKSRVPVAGDHSHRGLLARADDDGFVLEVDGDERQIAYGDVVSARTVFEWEKASKPGKR
ncbi:MAG: ribosome maturation factor RimP [Acidimicrobiia bacterium]|nr:ribosome maturation factor RimP [Acidimicrobiia bacterium]MDX2467729.1 ribosome maturation factor RimP [Acidimicrobiia bacterium]